MIYHLGRKLLTYQSTVYPLMRFLPASCADNCTIMHQSRARYIHPAANSCFLSQVPLMSSLSSVFSVEVHIKLFR